MIHLIISTRCIGAPVPLHALTSAGRKQYRSGAVVPHWRHCFRSRGCSATLRVPDASTRRRPWENLLAPEEQGRYPQHLHTGPDLENSRLVFFVLGKIVTVQSGTTKFYP